MRLAYKLGLHIELFSSAMCKPTGYGRNRGRLFYCNCNIFFK